MYNIHSYKLSNYTNSFSPSDFYFTPFHRFKEGSFSCVIVTQYFLVRQLGLTTALRSGYIIIYVQSDNNFQRTNFSNKTAFSHFLKV